MKPVGSVSVTVTVFSSRSTPRRVRHVMVYWPVLARDEGAAVRQATPRFTAGSEVALTICAMSSTRSSPDE